MKFADRLKELRHEYNLQQKDVANKLNYGYTAISNYETGKNEPSINDLKKIAELFNVSIDYLVGFSDIKNPYQIELINKVTPKTYNKIHKTILSMNKNEFSALSIFLDGVAANKQETNQQLIS